MPVEVWEGAKGDIHTVPDIHSYSPRPRTTLVL